MNQNTDDKKASVLLRLPLEVKRDLEDIACRESRSLNGQLVVILQDFVRQDSDSQAAAVR